MTKTWRCNRCGWLSPMDARACASCDKRKPRAKKAKPPPVFRPWKCVIVALDAGSKSGWSVWALGKLVESGEFNIYTDAGVAMVAEVCDKARTLALKLGVPWCAWIEASWGGHMGVVGRAGAGWYWTYALRNAQLPIARIGDVYPSTWRARALPKGANGKKRDDVRAVELATARKMVEGRNVGQDEAPAILIGKWATQAGETGELLPKNQRTTT